MYFNKTIKIGGFEISKTSKTFIIAEAGVNHCGDMMLAKKLIDLAVEAKADAIKFQAFKAEHLILNNVNKAPYQLETTGSSETQYQMLKKLEVTKEQNIEMRQYCDSKGIIFLTTPFDDFSLNELKNLDLPAYKIASTDITNLPFLKKVASEKKPIILSTGMAYITEVEMALKEIYPINKEVILLQCSANYPIKDKEANLRIIQKFIEKFNILVGYSDHSVGVGAGPYAVAIGAKIIEKHFTLDKAFDGPDHMSSLSPEELVQFVSEIRKVELYLGTDQKIPTISELETRKSLQKYFVASKEIQKGELFCEDNIAAKRTGGNGISPLYFKEVFEKKALKKLLKDELIVL